MTGIIDPLDPVNYRDTYDSIESTEYDESSSSVSSELDFSSEDLSAERTEILTSAISTDGIDLKRELGPIIIEFEDEPDVFREYRHIDEAEANEALILRLLNRSLRKASEMYKRDTLQSVEELNPFGTDTELREIHKKFKFRAEMNFFMKTRHCPIKSFRQIHILKLNSEIEMTFLKIAQANLRKYAAYYDEIDKLEEESDEAHTLRKHHITALEIAAGILIVNPVTGAVAAGTFALTRIASVVYYYYCRKELIRRRYELDDRLQEMRKKSKNNRKNLKFKKGF